MKEGASKSLHMKEALARPYCLLSPPAYPSKIKNASSAAIIGSSVMALLKRR